MQVIKRDGKKVPFNKLFIENAINAAARNADTEIPDAAQQIATDIQVRLVKAERQEVPIKEIQNMVENMLMASKHKNVARRYIEYRHQRDRARESGSKLLSDIEGFLDQTNEEYTKENANKDAKSVNTHRDLLSGILSKHLATTQILPPHLAKWHEEGWGHAHDLDYLLSPLTNCIDQSGWITIRDRAGDIKTIQLLDLIEMFGLSDGVNELPVGVSVLSRNGWSNLDAVSIRPLDQGEAIYKIKTKNGLALSATAKHRIPVISDGVERVVEVADIQLGQSLLYSPNNLSIDGDGVLNLIDYIDGDEFYVCNLKKFQSYVSYRYGSVIQRILRDNNIVDIKNLRQIKLDVFKRLCDLIEIPYDVYSQLLITRRGAKAKIPLLLQISNEFARMIGYVLADGCVSKSTCAGSYQVTFSNTNQELLDDFIRCAKIVFPSVNACVVKPSAKTTTPCTHVTLANKVVCELFRHFKRNSNDITVPDFIIHGDDELKRNFIAAAYDCDGNMSQTVINYTTVCESYANQMVMLLQSLGYNPGFCKDESTGKQYKVGKIAGYRNYDTYYVRLYKAAEINEFITTHDSVKARKIALVDRRGVAFDPAKIVSIKKEYYDSRYVFDLQTTDHWFVVNNFVVHNCQLVNYRDMLSNGFAIGNAKIGQPQSIGVAATVLTQIIQAVASSQYGGQTSAHIDTGLKPYVEKSYNKLKQIQSQYNLPDSFVEDGIRKEVHDAMQTFLYQVNSLTTTNGF